MKQKSPSKEQQQIKTLSCLPEDIVIEILVKLPVKSLLRFKSVCKRWNSLIKTTSFIIRYNSPSRRHNNSKLLCFREDPITQTHVVSLHDHKTLEKIQDLEFPSFIDDDSVPFDKDIQIFGPVNNGIYCINDRLNLWGGTLILWNPCTKSYKHILPATISDATERDTKSFQIGFGYDDSINDYKIVVICHWDETVYNGDNPPTDRWHVRVYNNATESWTTIHNLEYGVTEYLGFPYIDFCSGFSANCFINGKYHWSCAVKKYPRIYGNKLSVLVFDMASETFNVMRGPPVVGVLNEDEDEDEDAMDDYCELEEMSVWVVKETIGVMVSCSRKETVKVWIMKEYGDEDSWELVSTIATKTYEEYRVIGIPNDKHIFFADFHGNLISYNFENDQVIEYAAFGPYKGYSGDDSDTLGVLNYVEALSLV
ncbi:hypothetical protein SOVF_188480 [Spinacia oleracea]|uniref:F-box/kelch-repeat protein At3g23880-like n=1 Tax=Spinacia oleracea TaxID=3562 RepID=A0A9R0IAU9_SPIOL|nr:F-box/kelch-repeat protein At3g23880-like [Spinacia oleracea]KNA05642.1 hypothetical protein SOVF_188480 [Spinacia oleracea]